VQKKKKTNKIIKVDLKIIIKALRTESKEPSILVNYII